MRFYLAARYSRRDELKRYRKELRQHMHQVEVRWLDGTHEIRIEGSDRARDADRRRVAMEVWSDVTGAEVVLSFTDEPRSLGAGGRVELGVAMALGKICVVIGPRENVFHHMPGLEVYPTWQAFVSAWFPDWNDEV